MKNIRTGILTASCTVVLSAVAGHAVAANWLMLQGTERESAAPRVKSWGFIQVQYQNDSSDPNAAGGYVPPKLIGPNLDDQEGFNVNRARIGLRGSGFPLDGKVNYFLLAELGNNGITYGADGKHLTDASITLNYIDGARIRAGLFKYPGAEEGLQAIHVFDYINFTSVTNQLLLERFPQSGDTFQAPTATPNANMNQYSRAVGAFRDVGIQVFDAFRNGDWEHSYALMYGNGNGLNYGDNDSNKDIYAYWSSELIFAGQGPRRQGMKIFAWHQDGKRTNPLDRTQEQDRTRTGFGVKYLKKPFRVTAEYMDGEGMIFQGQHRPLNAGVDNAGPPIGTYNDEEADGFYIEGGWYIPGTKWEIDLRYDTYTRGENHPTAAASDESNFDTITIGTQYHFNKKTRINAEYSDRDFESDTTAVDNQLKDVKGRFAIQLTHIF